MSLPLLLLILALPLQQANPAPVPPRSALSKAQEAKADALHSIATKYKLEAAAIVEGDAETAASTYATDFKATDRKGKGLSFQAVTRPFGYPVRQLKGCVFTNAIVRFSYEGKLARVSAGSHMELEATNPRTKQPGTLVGEATREDVWVHRGSDWYRQRSRITSELKMWLPAKSSARSEAAPAPK